MEEPAHVHIQWTGIQAYLELWKKDQLNQLKSSHPHIEITITLKEKAKNIKIDKETEEGPIEIKCLEKITEHSQYVTPTSLSKKFSMTPEDQPTFNQGQKKHPKKPKSDPPEGFINHKQNPSVINELTIAFLKEEENSQHITRVRTMTEKRRQKVKCWGVELSGHVVVSLSEAVRPYKAKENTFSSKGAKAKRHEIPVVDIFNAIEHLLDNKAPEWEKKGWPHESIVFKSPVKALKKWSTIHEIKNEMTFFSTDELPDIITPYASLGSSGHSPGRVGSSAEEWLSEGVSSAFSLTTSTDCSDTIDKAEQFRELGLMLETPLAPEEKSPKKRMVKTHPTSPVLPHTNLKDISTLTVPYAKDKRSFWNTPKKDKHKNTLLSAPELMEHKSPEKKSNEKVVSLAKQNPEVLKARKESVDEAAPNFVVSTEQKRVNLSMSHSTFYKPAQRKNPSQERKSYEGTEEKKGTVIGKSLNL